jgi:hypothetical protein
MISAGLVQRHPRRFDGALPFCGLLGGAVGLWNQNLDLQYAIKTLLAADPNPAVSVPASQLELVQITNWRRSCAAQAWRLRGTPGRVPATAPECPGCRAR